jgi:hypothetical protein
MDNKISHLEMIQTVINRMAQNSLTLKEWSLGLVSALVAVAVTTKAMNVVYIAFLPAIVFWILDAYYLRFEKCFRALFDSVRKKEGDPDFNMDIRHCKGAGPFDSQWWKLWLASFFSLATFLFHAAIIIAILLSLCLLPQAMQTGAAGG